MSLASRVMGSVFNALSDGAWLEAAGKVIHWRFYGGTGAIEHFTMDFRNRVAVFPQPPALPPNATVDLDVGVAARLSESDAVGEDVLIAVKSNRVRVSGDVALLRRLAMAALQRRDT